MNKADLIELIRSGEDSTLEFKRDAIHNYDLAKVLVAFLNLEGGTVLLGVEDDGRILGTSRERLDEWVAELCRVKIDPPVVPLLSWARDAEPGRDVLAIRVPHGSDKPYACVHGNRRYYIRVGNTTREASREELERMYQASGRLLYGLKPVSGAGFDALNQRHLRDYFGRVMGGSAPPTNDVDQWQRLLQNLDLMTPSAGYMAATVDGMLLFGKNPKRFVPQSGIRAICYLGSEPDYATRADEDLKGPMVPLCDPEDGELVKLGLVDKAWDFVRRNTTPTAHLHGARRIDRWEFPEEAVREAVVNALVHRDYSIAGTDIMLAIFADRLEVVSPGRLPNTVTVDGMKLGMRYARNQTLANVMRDYGYVDARGMGVRNKIIPAMRRHNGTEPDLIAEEHRFTVRLWKERSTV